MSKPTVAQIAYALYILALQVNGTCPYCKKSLSMTPWEYRDWHYEQEHTDKKKEADHE
jgi:hypothetical protein